MNERRNVLELFESQKDAWTKRASEGIEKYRKGDAVLKLVDKNGNPVAGANISVTHKKHEFKFGANIFLLDQLESSGKNELYKKHFAEIFNMATLPFYWDTLEPTRGAPRYGKDSENIYRRPAIDICMEYCEENGIEPREHALAYDQFFPQWLRDASVDEVKKALEKRMQEIAERYADRIPTIEVTNEMYWKKGKTKFYDEPDFVEWCFKTAEKYFPNNELAINEAQTSTWADCCRATNKYYAYIEANILKGARIDAIGLQYHMFHKRENEFNGTRYAYDPLKLYRYMDLYSNFGKPLQITEITIPAYSNDADDEELQAEILEMLYTIWFSHPNMEQIVYWNLVDGYAHVWDPEKIKASQGNMTLGENQYYGGLIRFDMTPKPAYYTLKKLIEETWHTEETVTSDANGVATFRGFYGEYDVTVEANGEKTTHTVNLSKKRYNVYKIEV